MTDERKIAKRIEQKSDLGTKIMPGDLIKATLHYREKELVYEGVINGNEAFMEQFDVDSKKFGIDPEKIRSWRKKREDIKFTPDGIFLHPLDWDLEIYDEKSENYEDKVKSLEVVGKWASE